MPRLPAKARARLAAWAQAAWPEETCGFLLGSTGRVRAVTQVRNAAISPLTSYAIEPLETLASAERAARDGFAILGTWHSHPDGAADLSDADHAGDPWGIVLVIPVRNPGGRLRS